MNVKGKRGNGRGTIKNASFPSASYRLRRQEVDAEECDSVDGLSEEGNIIYSLLSSKLDKILSKLDEKDEAIRELKHENTTLRNDIRLLEERIDSIETHDRRCNLILSGDGLPAAATEEDPAQLVISVLKNKLNYELPRERISSVYRLGTRSSAQGPDRRRILVKLGASEDKSDIVAAFRTVKPMNLYANDDLVASRAKVLHSIRIIRKKCNRVLACGSLNGRVYMWLKPPDLKSKSQRIFVYSMFKLRDICMKEFGTDLDVMLESSNGV